nr:UDP-glucose iridoid glucosyltransferase-like [Ipomoea batatas]
MEIQGVAGGRRRRIILVPFPVQGHITPMLQLGSILRARGFSITVAHTEYNAPNPSTHPEFMFLGLSDGLGAGYDMSFDKILGAIYIMNERCGAPLVEYVEKQTACGEEIACIVHDNIMFFVDAVATHLKIPAIVQATFSAAYFQALVSIIPRFDAIFPFQDSMLEEPLPDLYPLRYKDGPFHPTQDNDIPEPVRNFYRTTNDIRSAVACICNSTDYLEHSSLSKLQTHYKVPFFPIGPFHKLASSSNSPTNLQEEDPTCLPWLDTQAPLSVLYVSFGSVAVVEKHAALETAWGLINSGRPFLWVVRPGSVHGVRWTEFLPEGFEELVGRDRGRVVKWAPQQGVLAHPAVGAFMTHCGWNSTLESICAGIPMICRPVFSDQLVTARYLSEVWKVGLEMEVIDRDVVERSVRMMMIGEEGKDMRKRVVDLKQKVESCVEKDGCSYKALNELVEFISSLHHKD